MALVDCTVSHYSCFGTKKLKNLGSDLGGAVRGFKDGLKEEIRKKPLFDRK